MQVGPNLYAYVKQNPWTMWDPHGLSGFSDLQKSAADDIANGSPVKGYSKAVVASLWNAFSFGNAETMGGIEDATRDGDMSIGQAGVEATKGTLLAMKDAALTYGTGGAVLKLATKYDKVETLTGVVTNVAEGDYAGALLTVAGEASPGGKGAKKTNLETDAASSKLGWGEQPGSPHVANVRVTGPDGKTVHKGRTTSGNMTPTEKEIGGHNGSNASHTEAKAVMDTNIPSGPGYSMTITGGKPPCSSCQGYMNTHARETGTAVSYQWREDGKSQKWNASSKPLGPSK